MPACRRSFIYKSLWTLNSLLLTWSTSRKKYPLEHHKHFIRNKRARDSHILHSDVTTSGKVLCCSKAVLVHSTRLVLSRDCCAKKTMVLRANFFSIVEELVKKGSLVRTKLRLQKDTHQPFSFRRLLRRSSLFQQRGVNWFKALVVRRGESGKRRFDCFLDSWHTADLVKSVHWKLVAAHNPWVLKNLKHNQKRIGINYDESEYRVSIQVHVEWHRQVTFCPRVPVQPIQDQIIHNS